jgi:hypothetical protein
MSPDPGKRPNLESLLRLKRAETPSQEFWTRFERELREKQLAAIVEKRPWWCAFPRTYVFVLRHNLQIGSAAALALAFVVSYHEFRAYPSTSLRSEERGIASPAAPGVPTRSALAAALPGRLAGAVPDRVPAAGTVAAAGSPARNLGGSRPEGIEAASQAIPSERQIAAALAVARPGINDSMPGLPSGFEAQVASVTTQVQEPLAQMTTPWEERRARLIAGPTPAMATGADFSGHLGERLASRLSDDRLYESMSRYGVDQGGVSIRF